jgi:hypothetical protein
MAELADAADSKSVLKVSAPNRTNLQISVLASNHAAFVDCAIRTEPHRDSSICKSN